MTGNEGMAGEHQTDPSTDKPLATDKALATDKNLVREAFALLMAIHDDPGPAGTAHLEAWKRQSPDHAVAAAQAEADWALLAQVDDEPLSAGERVQLAVAAKVAGLKDHPARLARPVGVVALCLAAWFMVADGGFLDQPAQEEGQQIAALEVPDAVFSERYQTSRGQTQELDLPDGSVVWLDWGAQAQVTFTEDERRIVLSKGKAYFKVTSDSDRPFVVETDGVAARALGTEFVVHRLDRRDVDVAVLEGVVGVTANGATPQNRLEQAQALRVVDGIAGPVRTRGLSEIGTWRDGLLVFENRPLREVLEVLEPYTSFRFRIRTLAEPDRPVSGTFVVTKADSALRALMQDYRLVGEVEGRNILVLRSAPPERPG